MDLLWRLINHEFVPFPLRHKHIESPKPRDLHVPGIEDKLVQHLICGEYSGEQLAVKYFCWRVHATKGNTRNMVEATDRKFNKMLEPYGLQLKIVHCDRGKIHWRVMPVYLKEGDNGTDNIPAC